MALKPTLLHVDPHVELQALSLMTYVVTVRTVVVDGVLEHRFVVLFDVILQAEEENVDVITKMKKKTTTN